MSAGPPLDPLLVTISPTAAILLLAASDLNLPVLHDLLSQKNQSPNVQDPETLQTPLHRAILSCTHWGKPAKDSREKEDIQNDTSALDESSQQISDAEKVLRLLLENGAIWNSLDVNNETPACIAYKHGLDTLYEIMVDAGVKAELLFGKLEGYMELAGSDDEEEEEEEEEEGMEEKVEEEEKVKGRSPVPEEKEEDIQVTSEAYLNSNLVISDDKILDEDSNGVMMLWESNIMSHTASLLLPSPNLRVLNIGYGLGIIDSFLQSHSPSSHHIIEAHPQILKTLQSSPISSSPGVVIHSGRWQDVLDDLSGAEDMQFDAVYFDTFAEDYTALKLFFEEYLIAILKPGGRFGFFNGLGADRQISYDVYRRVVEVHLEEAGLDVEWEKMDVGSEKDVAVTEEDWSGVRRKYWQLGEYWLPICRWKGSSE